MCGAASGEKTPIHAYDRARDDGAVLEGDGHRLAGEAHQKTNEFHCCSRSRKEDFLLTNFFLSFRSFFICEHRRCATSGCRVHRRRQSARAVVNGTGHTAYRAQHTKHKQVRGRSTLLTRSRRRPRRRRRRGPRGCAATRRSPGAASAPRHTRPRSVLGRR